MYFLVIKRFSLDDIPFRICEHKADAQSCIYRFISRMKKGAVYASKRDQNLMQVDISLPLIALGLITFDSLGRPLDMKIYSGESNDKEIKSSD